MKSRHFLITGGAGFIGSHLVKALLANPKNRVTIVDNFDSFYSREQKDLNLLAVYADPSLTIVEADIRDLNFSTAIDSPDVIVHLAAKTGVRPSITDPEGYYDVNVKGTQRLLEFAREKKVPQFVFASSSSVYGVNKNIPWKEEEKLMPISPYAASKLAAEMLGHVYHSLFGIRFLALRFFTVYGPSQRPDLAIHRFVKHILKEEELPVFGDGSSQRDYTYVSDVVAGILAAIEYRQSGFEILNLGNNHSVSLLSLIHTIETVLGKKANIRYLPQQPGDVPVTSADISKATMLLNYKPVTSLEDGIREFYHWYRHTPAIRSTAF